MDNNRLPEPRFNEFTEQLDEDGKAFGFLLTDSEFLFKYDRNGGWVDEENNYFNHEGVLQLPEEQDEDEERSEDIDDAMDDLD